MRTTASALSQGHLSVMDVAERLAGFEPGTGYTLTREPGGRTRREWNPSVLAAAKRFRRAVTDGQVTARVTPKRTPPNQVSRTWASCAPPEASARAGMEIVCTSRGTPEHRDSGA